MRPSLLRLLTVSVALVACLSSLDPAPAVAQTAKKARILMITESKGFKHGSVNRDNKDGTKKDLAAAEVAMIQLGQQTGLFTVDCSQDSAKDFTKENLQNYDIVFFYTTGGRGQWKISDETFDYFFKEWLPKKGHGFVGTHSASDTMADYKPYWDMIGGSFNGHPWGSGETVTISVHDTKHPGSRMFGDEFQIKDEIYWYKNWQPEKVRVLMSLNIAKCQTKGGKKKIKEGDKEVEVVEAHHVPISWVKQYGDGRVFYTNLGHNEATWANKQFLESVQGGIQWILGQKEGDATPNPELSKAQEEKAIKDAGATGK